MDFPGDSADYRAARERLLEEEIELRRMTERVAASRRALPLGGVVPEDYVFRGESGDVRLSELFGPRIESVAIYCYMVPRHKGDERPAPSSGPMSKWPLDETPCPSCTAFIDELDGVAPHVTQRMGLAIVAGVPIDRLLDVAGDRRWRHLQLLSGAGNTFRRDYQGESETGDSLPMMNVFHRDANGTIRHHWASEMLFAPTDDGQDPRHMGTLEPLWNLFDLTPEGRPSDWNEQLQYDR